MIGHRLRRVIANSYTPIQFIGATHGAGDDSTTIVNLASPANTQVGDLIVVIGATASASGYLRATSVSGVSGVTGRIGASGLDITTAICTIGGAGNSVIRMTDPNSASFSVSMLVFRYAKWGGVAATITTAAAPATIPTITTTTANAVAVAYCAIINPTAWIGSIGTPSGYTSRSAFNDSVHPRIAAFSKLQAVAGAVAGTTCSMPSGQTGRGNQFWLDPL